MSKVLVFETYEEACKQLDYAKANTSALDELEKRVTALEEDYLSRPDVKEKRLKAWEAANERLKEEGIPPSSLELALKSFTPEEVEQARRGAGKGLEITALINLQPNGKWYSLDLSIHEKVSPRTKDELIGENSYESYALYGIDYKSIPKLVKGVQEAIAETERSHYGATIKPVFYTVMKLEPIFSYEQKQEMITDLENDPQHKKDLKGWGLMERILWKLMLWKISRTKDTARGLTEKEREEFEKLYFNR